MQSGGGLGAGDNRDLQNYSIMSQYSVYAHEPAELVLDDANQVFPNRRDFTKKLINCLHCLHGNKDTMHQIMGLWLYRNSRERERKLTNTPDTWSTPKLITAKNQSKHRR